MWFAKARQDLKTPKHLRPIEVDFFSGIVFHCQQCIEKAIKGVLTSKVGL
ncbi:MAG: HEPN domain-containing protein [Pseudobdellovibrionaceae bacterium]